MAGRYLAIELQDDNGNVIYPHTEADIVFTSDGTTVEENLGGDVTDVEIQEMFNDSNSQLEKDKKLSVKEKIKRALKKYQTLLGKRILDTVEEVEANTDDGYLMGAKAGAALINDLVSNVYIGDDGKIHVVKGGADSGLNFSSFPENLRFYTTRDFDGSILSFKVKDKSILTFSLNTRYNNGAGYYPTQDYLEIFDGQPTVNDYTNLISGLSKIATLSKNGMTFIDASPYLALCKTGYITLAIHSKSANAAICYVKDIVLK